MINTNIKNSHLRIENLFKSIFTEVPNTSISLNDESVIIEHNDQSNPDAASIEIIKLEEVVQCQHIAGDMDYLLFVEVKDMDAYQVFLRTKLASIPNIANVQSSFVMKSLKN